MSSRRAAVVVAFELGLLHALRSPRPCRATLRPGRRGRPPSDPPPAPPPRPVTKTTYPVFLQGMHLELTEPVFISLFGQCCDLAQARWGPTAPQAVDPPDTPEATLEQASERVHAWAIRYRSGPADLTAQLTRLREQLREWRTRREA